MMNDNINMSQQDLLNLINLAKNQQPEAPKIPTSLVFQKYMDTHKLSSYTVTFYNLVFKSFRVKYPTFPTDAIQIDEYIANLKAESGSTLSYVTRNNHLTIIKSFIKFAVKTFNIPDYLPKISRLPKHQVETDHITKSPEELLHLINRCSKPLHRLIILTLIDSGCRIGELGFTPEHSGLTADHIFPDLEEIHIIGKTGFHKMHCSAELCEALLQNASPSGAIFHTPQHPDGMTAHDLTDLVHWLFRKTFSKTAKMGAHTIRHSVGTMIADLTGQPIAVKDFLRHSKIDMSMNYIHESERRKSKHISPLNMIGAENLKHTQQQQAPIPMLTDGTETNTTALTISTNNEQIEKVEAVFDLTESMFPEPDHNDHRLVTNYTRAKAMQTAFKFYASQFPDSPVTGELHRFYKALSQRSKLETVTVE